MRVTRVVVAAPILVLISATAAHAIPAWARKYNVNCSACHYPAPPRLNIAGLQFRWAGYRMPNEIGEKVDVSEVKDYVSIRGRVRYDYQNPEEDATTSTFAFSDATLFYSGPFGRNYGAFFELEREAEDEIGLTAQVQAAWGRENSYGGFRVGQFHWLPRVGVAGFDRPTGISTTRVLANPTTTALPFRMARDQKGLEAFYVAGRNRISAEVLDGINAEGVGDEPDEDTNKDFVVIEQYLFDDVASGVTAVGYYGSLDVDGETSHIVRLAVSANKVWRDYELMGGYMYSQDKDLPIATFEVDEVTGNAFFVALQKFFPEVGLTAFGRFDWVDPDKDMDDNEVLQYVAGLVLPVGLPEYLRLAAEYSLLNMKSSDTKDHRVLLEVMLNY
jgi:hypothetical protein